MLTLDGIRRRCESVIAHKGWAETPGSDGRTRLACVLQSHKARARLPLYFCCCIMLLVIHSDVQGATFQASLQPDRSDTVATRPRPELEPPGIAAGSFLVYPKLGYTLSRDDNIFADNTDTVADVISIYSPSLAASSRFSRHAINLFAGADLGRYKDFTTENYDDWQVSGNARIDASYATQITLGASYSNLHEPRDSPDSAGGLNPGVFTLAQGYFDMDYQPGVLSVTPIGSYRRYKYQDVEALVLGTPVTIKQDDRDRKEYMLGLRGAYEAGTDHYTFIRLRSFATFYDRLQRFTGFDRSSDGLDAAVGVAVDFGGVTRGRFDLGYRKQDYIAPLPDISAPIFNFDLIWKPSELTTVELDAGRDLAETTAPAFSGYLTTFGNLAVGHELLRSLLLRLVFGYIDDDYVGIGSATRVDKTVRYELGAKWFVNRYLNLDLAHSYTERETTDSSLPPGFPNDDFERNVSWIRIVLQH